MSKQSQAELAEGPSVLIMVRDGNRRELPALVANLDKAVNALCRNSVPLRDVPVRALNTTFRTLETFVDKVNTARALKPRSDRTR